MTARMNFAGLLRAKTLKSLPAVCCPVIHARLAIPRFAVRATSIGLGIALYLASMFCCRLVHFLLLRFGLNVELRVVSQIVEVWSW